MPRSSNAAALRHSISRVSTSTAGRCSSSRSTHESLPSFGGVLDRELARAHGKSVKLESLKRADRELVEDTLRVMSITFSYIDGAASLDAFMKKHGERAYA